MTLREIYPDEVSPDVFTEELARVSNSGPVDITLVSDGGPWAVHDMPCPVCLEHKAIVHLGGGGFGPCAACAREGWQLVQKRTRWWQWGPGS